MPDGYKTEANLTPGEKRDLVCVDGYEASETSLNCKKFDEAWDLEGGTCKEKVYLTDYTYCVCVIVVKMDVILFIYTSCVLYCDKDSVLNY